jgi:ubiquinone/menaquinone biosynthesis C-methylase UbiE
LLVDVGCGPAEIEPRVKKLGYRYFGIDTNLRILHKAANKYNLAQADALRLPLPQKTASIVLMNMLPHSLGCLWNFDMAVEEVLRVLEDNGLLMITMLTEQKTQGLVERFSFHGARSSGWFLLNSPVYY